MGADKLVSKKLGVAGGAIAALATMDNANFSLAALITVIALVYVAVQGKLDSLRIKNDKEVK